MTEPQNGGTATLTGFVATDLRAGKIGNAYNFSTANSMTATPANVTAAFTESAWVNLSSAGYFSRY